MRQKISDPDRGVSVVGVVQSASDLDTKRTEDRSDEFASPSGRRLRRKTSKQECALALTSPAVANSTEAMTVDSASVINLSARSSGDTASMRTPRRKLGRKTSREEAGVAFRSRSPVRHRPTEISHENASFSAPAPDPVEPETSSGRRAWCIDSVHSSAR